jgi:2-dehydro-3-deoxyphosphogluconate aldolase/(4S)-4-hydroxy-2-oxoglutarate aldolase
LAAVKKDAVLAQFRAEKVIGLLAADEAETLIACGRALTAGGLHSAEIALTTPALLGALDQASKALPDFRFGLGTVLDVETARAGILAGASFIVTSALRPEVITLCRRYNVAVISGSFTAADIVAAHDGGADAAKVFPGEHFGPMYIRALKEKMPHVEMIAVGGVTPDSIPEFLRAGAMAAVAGSSLLDPKWINEGNWNAITDRARAFTRGAASLASAGPAR